jgi:8-oxo-dGTP pyrophosphatase MutT (NUDIX family)
MERTAIMVVLNSKGHVLIQHRTATAPWMPLHWDLPGGTVEENESYLRASIRETQEECGITPMNVGELGMVSDNVFAFLGHSDMSPKTIPNAEGVLEHDDFRWVNADDLNKYNIVQPARTAILLAWGTPS